MRFIVFMFFVSCSSAQAGSLLSRETAISWIAEAHAWGDLCRNWQVDFDAMSRFMLDQEIIIDDRYRAIYAPAREKAKREATRSGDPRQACDHALDLFGPAGSKIRGLMVRKLP